MRVRMTMTVTMPVISRRSIEHSHRLVENKERSKSKEDCSSTIRPVFQLDDPPNNDIPLFIHNDGPMFRTPGSFTKERVWNQVQKYITEETTCSKSYHRVE